MKLLKKKGFTLLEIIIVIIIIGVLASLAMPRFFKMVDYSKSSEALTAIGAIRQAMERCALQNLPTPTYVGCTIANLDLENPGTDAKSLFTYVVSNQSATGYTITASFKAEAASTIIVTQTAAGVTKVGAGKFLGIR